MKSSFKLTLILFTLILFLTACKKDTTEFVLNEFSGYLSFCCEEEEYKGNFVFKNKDEMYLNINFPQNISGISFAHKNKDTTLSFDGVTIGMRETSPIKNLFRILSDFAEEPRKIKTKGTDTVSITNESIKYDVVLDCDAMKIKEINAGDIVYTFS